MIKFEDVLLALIARQSASGYDLGRWLAVDGVFVRANADQSQIYKALARLVERGYAEFVIKKQEGAPDAKVYSPTTSGIAHLSELAASPYVPPARWQEPDFTVRYGLFAPLHPESVPDLIETEINFRESQRARFRNRPRRVAIGDNAGGASPDLVVQAFDDMHHLNGAALDAWLAGLRQLLARWRSDQESH